jgi:phage gpG-like protein
MAVDVQFTFPDLADRLQRGAQQVRQELAVAMQTNRGLLFDAEGAFNDHDPWAPLVFRSGQILAKRGVLKKSLQGSSGGYVQMDDQTVTIGTNVAYAAMMNAGTAKMPGGVLRPVHAKALRIPLPKGMGANDAAEDIKVGQRRKKIKAGKKLGRKDDYAIFVKYVKIPARPFDNITDADARDFAAAAEAAIAELLNG